MEETTKHSLATKLTHVAAACGYVQKDASNAFHKYRYVSAANILGHVNEALCAHGLAVVETEPTILSENGAGKERVVTVRMRVVVQDADTGERAIFVGLGSGQDAGDKAVMKASTAALKYAWLGALSISTGDDPEADTDTDKRGAKPPRTPPPSDRTTAKTMPAPTPPPPARNLTDLEVFRSRLAGLSTRYDAANLWVGWRERLHATGDDVVAWADLAETFSSRGWDFRPAANPRAWLKSAAAEITNRAQKPDNDPPPNGTDGVGRRQSTTSTDAHGSANEAAQSTATQASVATLPHVPAWATTAGGIRAHLASITALRHLENSIRDHGRDLGAAYLEPAAERLIALDGPDAHGSYMAPTTAKGMVKAWAEAGPRPKAETRRAVGR